MGEGDSASAEVPERAERLGPVVGASQIVGAAIVILALLAVLAALAIGRAFAVPVILAFLLSLVFSGPCRWLRRKGIPEAVTAAAIVLSLVAGLTASTAILAIPASEWIEDAPRVAQQVERKLKDISGVAAAVAEADRRIEEATTGAADGAEDPVEVVIEDTSGPLTTVAVGAPMIVAQTLFVLILTFFMLASGNLFYERLVSVLPRFADKKRAIQIAYDVEREVSRYLLAITCVNAGLGVIVGVSLGLLGMPNPLAFGLLAFGMNFVPFVGAVIGVIVSFGVALVSLPTLFDALTVAGIYLALTVIEGQVVAPWLVGRHLSLNTVVILISVAFWAWLWSVMGMIMAVPLLVTFRVLCSHIDALKPIGEFLSGPRR
jgi:predicted PurR-regulated permease PerM